jgi:hypothetical protein
MITRDGVLATDVHGYVDNEFDNPGPRLHEETQFITRGYHSLMNYENDDVFERLGKQLMNTVLQPKKDNDGTAEAQSEDQGYESEGSAVSMDRCRYSPAYPMCDDDCWLKQASPLPENHTKTSHQSVEVSSAEKTDLYTALESGFTRVLVIEPGTSDDKFKCTLEPMEIIGAREEDESQPFERRLYEALSYTWGDSTKCKTIECNDKQFGVSQNLFDALVNIRLPDKKRTIWVDALCINQDDDAEKSEQVRHMYAIYPAATRVIVWLGGESDDSDFTMRALSFIRNRTNRATIMRHDHSHECLVQLARVIKGIESLTKRPWFSRSWIRQEVAAAPKVTVRCGSSEASWTALKRSVNSLVRLRSKYEASRDLFKGDDDEFVKLLGPAEVKPVTLSFLKKDWVVGQSLLANGGDLGSIWYYHTGGLLDLLMAGRAYDATNPRDKVYAVLGMADVPLNPLDKVPRLVWRGHTQREPPIMEIDYSASVSEVYQHTAKYFINRDENLDVLCILPSHRDETSSDLPSWTPDWRVSQSSRPLYESWDYVSYKWGAAGFTKTNLQKQDKLNRLEVIGFEIAQIESLQPLYPMELPHLPERLTGSAVLFEEGKHLRRFAQSTRGPAIVPSAAVVGDPIWILLGCKMPMVLRPVPGTNEGDFEVIGPCYVSTIMFGEAIELEEAGGSGLEMRQIELV